MPRRTGTNLTRHPENTNRGSSSKNTENAPARLRLQHVYGNMSKIKFVGANAQSLAQRYFDLDKVRPTTSVSDSKLNDVQFVDVGYKHDANGNNIVSGINFQLKRGDKVGVVGMTGSGKTTFIDLLVGLINPTEGSISYNGKHVSSEKVRIAQNTNERHD